MVKFFAKDDPAVTIMATQGHFATSQSHINYYIDVTRIKVRVAEAAEAARSLRQKLVHHVTMVDTIVCLDGTEVLGGFLAHELEKGDFRMTNTHETMYVVQPEENSIHQFMFRENIRPSIEGKNVLVLVATMTTGETVKRAIECIEYYGGKVQGVVSIFSTWSGNAMLIATINAVTNKQQTSDLRIVFILFSLHIADKIISFSFGKLLRCTKPHSKSKHEICNRLHFFWIFVLYCCFVLMSFNFYNCLVGIV